MFRSLLALALGTLAACAPSAKDARPDSPSVAAIQLVDDGGQSVRLGAPARRVVSLVPSATETLIALGVADRVVGRTRYDVAPELASVPSVGGGLDPSVEAIVALRPDLVLAWSADKRRETQNALTALGVAVYAIRTEDTTDVFRGIANLGRLTARDSAAAALVARLHAEFDEVRRSVVDRPRPTVLYAAFNDPPMTAGPGTFIGQLIGLAGGRSVFDDQTALWPTVSMEEIVRRAPDVVVLPIGERGGDSTTAVAAMRERAGWRDLRAVRERRVRPVSANLLNRPGANLGAAARALRDAIHPEVATREVR